VDFSLCANRNRIPNDPVASKDRRQGTDPFFAYDVDYAYTGARLAHGEELIEPFGDAHGSLEGASGDRTGWLRMQSRPNRSPLQIPVHQGK
jgi:hypothetical protein